MRAQVSCPNNSNKIKNKILMIERIFGIKQLLIYNMVVIFSISTCSKCVRLIIRRARNEIATDNILYHKLKDQAWIWPI